MKVRGEFLFIDPRLDEDMGLLDATKRGLALNAHRTGEPVPADRSIKEIELTDQDAKRRFAMACRLEYIDSTKTTDMGFSRSEAEVIEYAILGLAKQGHDLHGVEGHEHLEWNPHQNISAIQDAEDIGRFAQTGRMAA
jgi:hypothetical protein